MKVSPYCDLALVNGRVVTVDAEFSLQESIGIKGNSIAVVGDDADVTPLIGPRTEVVDLKGKTVLPGINDSHAHTALWAGTKPPAVLDVAFPTVRSVRDIQESIRQKVRTLPPGEWVRGVGWDAGFLEECVRDHSFRLNRWLLDEAAPRNPVALLEFSVHTLWVNSKALELAGVNRGSRQPAGGGVELDPATGEPTGILKEFGAQDLVMRLIPPLTREQKREALATALAELSALGITSITDPALGPGGDNYQGGLLGSECIGVYQDLLEQERLPVRVNILYLFGDYGANSLGDLEAALPPLGFHSGFGNDRLQIGGVKIFADGIPPNKTAWVGQEYLGGGNGSLVLPGDTDEERSAELKRMIGFAHGHGFQVGVHAIGDLAIEAALAGFIEAEAGDPRGLRHYLMHVDFISPEQARRCATHGFGVNINPALPWTISDLSLGYVGLAQLRRQWPYRWIVDAGCRVAASSDAPCTYPSWLQGVQSAVVRASKASGTVYSPDQRLSVQEIVRAYTMGGAWQDRRELRKGSLEPGKLADLCVLDQDIFAVDPREIAGIKTVMTVADGKVVFGAGL